MTYRKVNAPKKRAFSISEHRKKSSTGLHISSGATRDTGGPSAVVQKIRARSTGTPPAGKKSIFFVPKLKLQGKLACCIQVCKQTFWKTWEDWSGILHGKLSQNFLPFNWFRWFLPSFESIKGLQNRTVYPCWQLC